MDPQDGTDFLNRDYATALDKTFTGHSSAVKAITVNGNALYSGSLDGSIKKWDATTGSLLSTFTLSLPIHSLYFSKNLLYVGVSSNSILCINANNGVIVTEFKGHSDVPTSIVVNGRYLFSGS